MSVTTPSSPVTPVVVGGAFTAQIPVPPGPPANLGARVELPVSGAILSSWQPASILANTANCTLDVPLAPGQYIVHWMTGGATSTYDAYQPLVVVGSALNGTGATWPAALPDDVRPDIDSVALLEQTRTVDEDTGDEAGTFTENTRPTAAQVEGVIDQAVDDILTEIPHGAMVDPSLYPRIRRAATFYAAMIIEGSWYREQLAERGGPLWQSEYQEAMKNIVTRVEEDYLENLKLGTMEPRDTEPGRLLA